jgi:hypothetical protein
MAMRRVIGSFQRLGLPCRPAMLHGGSVGEAEVKNSSKLKSESGMTADGEEVVACWSEDEASYSEAVVRATGARASTEGWMEACDAKMPPLHTVFPPCDDAQHAARPPHRSKLSAASRTAP